MKKVHFLAALAAISMMTVTACHDHNDEAEYAEKGSLVVEMDHQAGSVPFNLGTNYVTAAGDTIKFSKFNYFVSNFVLVKEDGSEYIVPKNDCYFLIQHENGVANEVKLENIPGGAYKSVRFTIGVDSLMSATPAEQRPAALDPVTNAAGMYWAWNSGYIFVKVEGTSPQAPIDPSTQERDVVYHVGGYGGNNPASPTMNNIKTVTLEKSGELAQVGQLGSDHSHGGTSEGVEPHAHVYVNVLEIFTAPTSFKVADNPVMHWGDFSKTLANNYADMFTLDHIHN